MSCEIYLEKLRKCTKPKYNELKTCMVESCHNSSTTTPYKIFVQVPQDLSRREKWFSAAGRVDSTESVFCCEDHFDLPNDMENWIKFSMTGCKICMKKDVIPYKLLGKLKSNSTKKKVTFLPKIVKKHRRKSPITIRKYVKFVDYDCRMQKRKPGVSILKKTNIVKDTRTEKQETADIASVKLEENLQLEESHYDTHSNETLDIKDGTIPTFELVENYTNEYFLVPLSDKKLEIKLEQCESVGNKNKVTKQEPKDRKRKIYCPPDENKIFEIEEYLGSHNKRIKKTEEVVCNEKYHKVDIFTIFGKSVADQLRSFPVDKAVSLQNQIQDLITEQRLKL